MHLTKATLLLSFLISVAGTTFASTPAEIIVAERGEGRVTLQDVDAYVMALPKHLRPGLLGDPQRIETVIQGLLINKQLAAWAREQGVEQDPHLQTQLQLARDEHLAKRARAISEDRLNAEMPDFAELAEEVFLTNPHRFSSRTTLQLEHILIRFDPRRDAEIRARAEEARSELLKPGSDFAAVFGKYSDEAIGAPDHTVGILSDVIPGTMEKPFNDAAFQLQKAGEVTPIVQTKYGLHVARLVSRKEAVPQKFEEVRDSLIAEQRERYTSREKGRLLETLNSQELKASQPVVAQLRTRYEKAAEGILPPPVDGSEPEPSTAATADQ